MARPSEPVEYLFRFHLHDTPDDLWHELTFKWKLSLDGAVAKIQQVVYNRFGQYDHIDTYRLTPGAYWTNVRSLWWFPARPIASDGFEVARAATPLDKLCGAAKNLPPDLAAQHEHYRLGTPKKEA